MSGTLSSLFGPAAGVTIGGVTLQDFEIPDHIPILSDMVLVEHRLPGGATRLQRTGRFYEPICWTGKMYQSGAVTRALAFDAMHASGQQQTLTWLGRSFQVVIEKWQTLDRYQNLVEYSISCRVVSDGGNGTPSGSGGLLSGLKDDIGSTLGVDLPTTADITNALGKVKSALATVSGVLPFGGSAFNAVNNALSQATGVVGAAAAVSNGQIGALQGAAIITGTVFPSAHVAQSAVNVLLATAAAGQLATNGPISGLVSRMTTNMTNAPT